MECLHQGALGLFEPITSNLFQGQTYIKHVLLSAGRIASVSTVIQQLTSRVKQAFLNAFFAPPGSKCLLPLIGRKLRVGLALFAAIADLCLQVAANWVRLPLNRLGHARDTLSCANPLLPLRCCVNTLRFLLATFEAWLDILLCA